MECIVGKVTIILLCFVGFILSHSDSSSSSSSDSSEEDESRTPASYLEYKVKGLNTALYYILHALQDDLKDGSEVDTSFFKRIKAIATKIKYFYGEVEQTNALMLGEILRTLPEYLKANLEEVGYNFNEYTAITSSETTATTIVTTNKT